VRGLAADQRATWTAGRSPPAGTNQPDYTRSAPVVSGDGGILDAGFWGERFPLAAPSARTVPERPGIYTIFDAISGVPIYVGETSLFATILPRHQRRAWGVGEPFLAIWPLDADTPKFCRLALWPASCGSAWSPRASRPGAGRVPALARLRPDPGLPREPPPAGGAAGQMAAHPAPPDFGPLRSAPARCGFRGRCLSGLKPWQMVVRSITSCRRPTRMNAIDERP
jgi:hypothetical protein